MSISFQRVGSKSNAHVGREFERRAKDFFFSINIDLDANIKVPVGVGEKTKIHAFDLGNETDKIIVECKSHKWTSGGNVPSAKLTVWNEAMLYLLPLRQSIESLWWFSKTTAVKDKKHLRNTICAHIITSFRQGWSFGNTMKKLQMHNRSIHIRFTYE